MKAPIKLTVRVVCPERSPDLWRSYVQAGKLWQVGSDPSRNISRAWANASRLFRLFRIGNAP